MIYSLYEYLLNYLYSPKQVMKTDDGKDSVSSTSSTNMRPPSRIKRFEIFTRKQYPDLNDEQVKYLRVKFYKIHRQMVVNKQFRFRRFDWEYLAAKMTGHETEKLELEGNSLDDNNKLWSEINQYVKLD